MKSEINNAELEKKLAVTEAVTAVEKERDGLTAKFQSKDSENKFLISSQKDRYENELKLKDEK